MLNLIVLLISLIAAAIIVAMLFFTTPAGIGPLGILIFFIMIYLVMLGITIGITRLYKRIVKKTKEMVPLDYATSGVLAFFPIMVLIFISIGVSNLLMTSISAVIFVVIGVFFMRKIW